MITINLVDIDAAPWIRFNASNGLATRGLTSLDDLEVFIRESAPCDDVESCRQLGRLAGVLAGMDDSVVWERDARSLGKLVDAYDFATGSVDAARAFGEGLAESVRHLNALNHQPDRREVEEVLGIAQ